MRVLLSSMFVDPFGVASFIILILIPLQLDISDSAFPAWSAQWDDPLLVCGDLRQPRFGGHR